MDATGRGWRSLKNILDGNIVELRAPRSFAKEDVSYRDLATFFFTAGEEVVIPAKDRARSFRETEMFAARVHYLHFARSFPTPDFSLPPCPCCWSRWLLGWP